MGRARHVLLDFDDVMFGVSGALGRHARERAITALPDCRPYRPRPLPITFGWCGLYQVLAYLARHEPDHAIEAERIVSDVELDAALTARPAAGLDHLLTVCAPIDRRVAVISALSESAVLATLRARDLDRHIVAVAARQGGRSSMPSPAIERAADLIGAAVPNLPGGQREHHAAVDRSRGRGDRARPAYGSRTGRRHRGRPAWPAAPRSVPAVAAGAGAAGAARVAPKGHAGQEPFHGTGGCSARVMQSPTIAEA